MIKILLADDHQIVTDGLRSILEKVEGIEVAGEARNGVEVLAQLEQTPVDVVVLDIEMPEMDGIEATRRIKEQFPGVKVLILSMYKKEDFVRKVLEEGADGYVVKEKSKEALVSAINTVNDGKRYLPPDLIDFFIPVARRRKKERVHLTEKERVVLQLLSEGLTAKQIGQQLDNEESTIHAHTRNLRRKFEVTNVVQLVTKAVKEGYLEL
ncbi:MAG: response regulator transcription factor [Lewinellaceae bacterium]|nr:response regulator transcription factor [Phaeodactylibacter sp.]MCB9352123.1 response regulator transcription factor [Lewinellaceae bacterium]